MPSKNKPYSVGVTVGRFSPFHAGNTKVIRKIAPYCDKIVMFVAGQRESMENPFSYALRKRIINKSIGPLTYKTKVLPAIIKKGNKTIQTGFLYTFLDKIKAMKEVDAIFIFVGKDRFDEYAEQFEEVRKQDGKKWKNVRIVNCGIGLNEYGKKIDATAIRGALLANDVVMIKQYLAPLLSENSNVFNNIYQDMRKEIINTAGAQQFDKLVKSQDPE